MHLTVGYQALLSLSCLECRGGGLKYLLSQITHIKMSSCYTEWDSTSVNSTIGWLCVCLPVQVSGMIFQCGGTIKGIFNHCFGQIFTEKHLIRTNKVELHVKLIHCMFSQDDTGQLVCSHIETWPVPRFTRWTKGEMI